MATLTETSYYARKGVNILIIAIVLIVVGRMTFFAAVGIKERLFPTPPPPANNALGPLPKPNSQGSLATPSAVAYTLETVDGGLPQMPRTLTVYTLTPDSKVSFGTFDRMKTLAGKMGFTGEPVKKEGSTYEISDPNNSLRTLQIDEKSGDFKIVFNYGSDVSVFSGKNFTSQNDVVQEARGFFQGLGLLTPDLASGSAEVSFLKLDGQSLVPTTSLANADAVNVNLTRVPIGESPIVDPNYQKGNVSALVIGNANQDSKILEASYYHSTIDEQSSGTYDPISFEEAYDKLQKGDAIFASLPNPLPKTIPIRSVSIAYLDPLPPQGFLQPVIVFSDDKDFRAYVPALKY